MRVGSASSSLSNSSSSNGSQSSQGIRLAPVDGCIITAPYFRLVQDIPLLQKFAVNIIA